MKLCEHCGGPIAERLPSHMDMESNAWMLGIEVEGARYCNQECADAVEFVPEPEVDIAIPFAMLDAATIAIQGLRSRMGSYSSEQITQVILEAAGVPALLARIAELKAELAERSAQ